VQSWGFLVGSYSDAESQRAAGADVERGWGGCFLMERLNLERYCRRRGNWQFVASTTYDDKLDIDELLVTSDAFIRMLDHDHPQFRWVVAGKFIGEFYWKPETGWFRYEGVANAA
jgi:hypothetical protein